jgi:ketosteroid isomerase-like protein
VGIQAIRAVLQGFLVRKGKIEIETQSVIQAGDIALLRSRWRLTGSGADGKPIETAHSSTEVVRRQPDGSWRYLIDHPFGAD